MKEIAIKMPDEMYDWFINGFPDKADIDELQRLVITGTVLPKGHGRLIDEQDAIDTLSVMFSGNDEILNDALECIEQLPEVIEADGDKVE